MNKILLLVITGLILFSCAPVLTREMLNSGIYGVPLTEIKKSPLEHKGKLFLLGGIIVNTTITKDGTLIEAIYVPVNSRGFLKSYGSSRGRFRGFFRSKEPLDPVVFGEKREITVAGEFIGLRKGKIGEMEYTFPFFEIKEVYLWEESKERDYYYGYPPYYYPYYPSYPSHYRYGYPYSGWWYY